MKETTQTPVIVPSLPNWTQVRNHVLEQSESAHGAAEEQAWNPLPTAFDTTTTTIQNSEIEALRHPDTPVRIPAEGEISTRTVHSPEDQGEPRSPVAYTHISLQPDMEYDNLSATKLKCGICCIEFTAMSDTERTDHFNECWMQHRIILVNPSITPKRIEPSHSDHQSNSRLIQDSCRTNKTKNARKCTICTSSLNALSSIDAFEHRVLCLRSLEQLPKSCAGCKTPFASISIESNGPLIAEHIHNCSVDPEEGTFEALQAAWYERHTAHKDPENCPFCSQTLNMMQDIDAFNHKRACLRQRDPEYCPICFDPLMVADGPGGWSTEDVLWHVVKCQHDSVAFEFQKETFELLEMRWKGRMLAVWRMSARHSGIGFGPRNGWTHHEHRHSYQTKQRLARNNGEGIYLAASSKLRAVSLYAENGTISTVSSLESTRVVCSNLVKFRRHAYCVHQMSDYGTKRRRQYDSVKYESVSQKTEEEMLSSDLVTVNGYGVDSEAAGRPAESAILDTGDASIHLLEHDQGTEQRKSRYERYLSAVENARTAGIRIPPGFELHEPVNSADLQP